MNIWQVISLRVPTARDSFASATSDAFYPEAQAGRHEKLVLIPEFRVEAATAPQRSRAPTQGDEIMADCETTHYRFYDHPGTRFAAADEVRLTAFAKRPGCRLA